MSYDLFYRYPFHGDALTGAFQNRNIFGLFMLVSSCVLSMLISKQALKQSLPFACILLIASIYCLIFSYSRASWLSYAVFSAVLFLASKKQHRLLASSIPIMIAIALFATNDGLFERLNQLLTGFDSGRIDIWLWAIEAFKNNWLLGYGLETMPLVDNAPAQPFVHNSVLEIAISLGLIGLISYAIIAWRVLHLAFKTDKAGLFAFGLALFSVSQFDHSILDGKRFIPILMLFATYTVIAFHRQRNDSVVT
jgi:O-antigen ligase